jgi:hypothetical protein
MRIKAFHGYSREGRRARRKRMRYGQARSDQQQTQQQRVWSLLLPPRYPDHRR